MSRPRLTQNCRLQTRNLGVEHRQTSSAVSASGVIALPKASRNRVWPHAVVPSEIPGCHLQTVWARSLARVAGRLAEAGSIPCHVTGESS